MLGPLDTFPQTLHWEYVLRSRSSLGHTGKIRTSVGCSSDDITNIESSTEALRFTMCC